jgi:hypothetical protein
MVFGLASFIKRASLLCEGAGTSFPLDVVRDKKIKPLPVQSLRSLRRQDLIKTLSKEIPFCHREKKEAKKLPRLENMESFTISSDPAGAIIVGNYCLVCFRST